MKINRKGIKGGIPTVTVVTVGRENRGPSGHGYYCFSLSVDLLRVVAHVPNQHGRVVPEHPAHWLICAQVVPRALRQEDDLRHAQYDGRRQRDELRERLISRERTTAAWHSNSTPDAVDASTAYQYLDAAAMACPGAGHGLRDGN